MCTTSGAININRIQQLCWTSPRTISNARLRTYLAGYFNLHPINQVVFLGPYWINSMDQILSKRRHSSESQNAAMNWIREIMAGKMNEDEGDDDEERGIEYSNDVITYLVQKQELDKQARKLDGSRRRKTQRDLPWSNGGHVL